MRIEHGQNAGGLAPVELEPKPKKAREKCPSRRASNKGCLLMKLTEYLQLLDWTGRQLKPGKRGAIPKSAPPILDRLNLSAELWLHAVEHFWQTPVGQSHHARLPLQRQSNTGQLSAGCSVKVKDSGSQENRELRRSASAVGLDGPEFSKLV